MVLKTTMKTVSPLLLLNLVSFITSSDAFAPRPWNYSSKTEDHDTTATTNPRSHCQQAPVRVTPKKDIQSILKSNNEVLFKLHSVSPKSSSSDQKSSHGGGADNRDTAVGTSQEQDKAMNFFKSAIKPLKEVTDNAAGNPAMKLMENPPGLEDSASKTYSSTTSDTSSLYNTKSDSDIFIDTIYHNHDHFHKHNHNHSHNHKHIAVDGKGKVITTSEEEKMTSRTDDGDDDNHNIGNSSSSSNKPISQEGAEDNTKQNVFNWSDEETPKPLATPYPTIDEEEHHIPKKSSEQILLEETLEHLAFTNGPTNVETMRTLHNLATYMYQYSPHEKDDAIKLLTICYQQQQAVLSPLHGDTILSLNNLTRIHANEGQYEKAKDVLLNSNYYLEMTIINNSHKIAKPQYQPADAHKKKKDLLRLDERILDTLVQLAFAYHREGIVDESIELYEAYLSHCSDDDDDDDDDDKRRNHRQQQNQLKASAQQNLAILYQAQGQFDKAIPLILECFNKRQIILGKHHQLTLGSMNNLAALYHKIGNHEKAMSVYTDCLELKIASLGKDHPDTKLTIRNIDRLKEAM